MDNIYRNNKNKILNMKNKLTGRSIQKYYDAVLAGIITMDEFFELSMVLPTTNLYTRNSQILNIL